MDCTAVSGDVTGAASKTLLSLLSTTNRRVRLKQLIIGSSGTPADAAVKVAVRRITADGTGTSVTPKALDAAQGTAACTAKANYSVEPTYEAGNLAEISFNQRATVFWEPPPGAEPCCPTGAGNGIGIQMLAGAAVPWNVTAVYDE